MVQHEKSGVGAQQRLNEVQPQEALLIAGDPVKFHAELHQGPHDGVVLQRTDQHMVTGTQKALEGHVQRGGTAGGEDHVVRVRVVEEGGKLFPQGQGFHARLLRRAVNAPVDVDADFVNVVFHCVADAGGLWK